MIATVDRKQAITRLLRGEVIWVKGEAGFAKRGRRATVLPEEEAEGNGRRNGRKERVCPTCGTRFVSTRPDQRFCSSLCEAEATEAGGGIAKETPAEEAPAEAGGDGREFAKILSPEADISSPPTSAKISVDHLAEVAAGEPEGAAKVSRKVEDEAEVRRLLTEVIAGALPAKAEPFTLPQERELHLWVSADKPERLEIDCNIPKYIRRLAVLYARGEFVPTAIDVWPYEGGPFVTAVEGHAPAKLLNLRGWTGRGRKGGVAEAVSMTNEEEGGEDG
jgi:hypothetical protein